MRCTGRITWLALQEGVDLDDQAAVAELLAHASMDIDQDPEGPAIAINGVDVTEAIRALRCRRPERRDQSGHSR